MALRLRVRQVKSAGGHPAKQGATVRALGIRRLRQVVEHDDTPQIRGMIFRIRHLLEVEEIEGEDTGGGSRGDRARSAGAARRAG
jgi:large subunit ribosomal protein L30